VADGRPPARHGRNAGQVSWPPVALLLPITILAVVIVIAAIRFRHRKPRV
jgi:hypothetical protein